MKINTCIRALADVNQINNCKSKLESKEQEISHLSGILGLAGNEVRFKILYLLHEEKEFCVCDLSDILNMNISAISQHLKKLKDGDIVDIRKEGQTYFYFIKKDALLILESFFNIINLEYKNFTL
ncbi:MAG TPA: transcriptional regulator [Bacteroidetes bacterium]|nr:transcriptional regulator [Bacteroidota bacterium]